METSEIIVESWFRNIKGYFTISNIACKGNNEIDLLALKVLNDNTIKRYHVEISISVSDGFSKITSLPFSEEDYKINSKRPTIRRSLEFHVKRKFHHPSVLEGLKHYGFSPDNYTKAIVSWGWEDKVVEQASKENIILIDFRDIISEITMKCRDNKCYFKDDTLRTIQLIEKAQKEIGNNKYSPSTSIGELFID